ncbi:MAG: DUF502 domain-containing protein [Lentisphaerae bacterium]|nr:DUF502 domain-containing protein [Lentisphaerota bacterium]MCP4101553.1 DUF502 domain-containing protein [Lentisphaerota bacterium]
MKTKKLKLSLWLRRRVITGLLVLVPVFVTLWLTGFLYLKLTTWAVKAIDHYLPQIGSMFWVQQSIRVLTLAMIIVILLLVGEFMRFKAGRWLAGIAQWILMKLPFLGTVYTTTRQIGEALLTPHGNMFRKVVMIEYPRKGVYAIGFLTNENPKEWEISQKSGKKLISVFVPTTPNPTSGFLLLLPHDDCIYLDMKVSDGMRLVISGGAVQMPQKSRNSNFSTEESAEE